MKRISNSNPIYKLDANNDSEISLKELEENIIKLTSEDLDSLSKDILNNVEGRYDFFQPVPVLYSGLYENLLTLGSILNDKILQEGFKLETRKNQAIKKLYDMVQIRNIFQESGTNSIIEFDYWKSSVNFNWKSVNGNIDDKFNIDLSNSYKVNIAIGYLERQVNEVKDRDNMSDEQFTAFLQWGKNILGIKNDIQNISGALIRIEGLIEQGYIERNSLIHEVVSLLKNAKKNSIAFIKRAEPLSLTPSQEVQPTSNRYDYTRLGNSDYEKAKDYNLIVRQIEYKALGILPIPKLLIEKQKELGITFYERGNYTTSKSIEVGETPMHMHGDYMIVKGDIVIELIANPLESKDGLGEKYCGRTVNSYREGGNGVLSPVGSGSLREKHQEIYKILMGDDLYKEYTTSLENDTNESVEENQQTVLIEQLKSLSEGGKVVMNGGSIFELDQLLDKYHSILNQLSKIYKDQVYNDIYDKYKITELHLENYVSTDLPENVGLLKDLRVLMIDNSLLKNIPSEIISCEELKELRIKESPITSVNPLVSNLENLVFLTIEGCDLRRVAVKDFCGPSLGFLALKDCKLQHIDLKGISSSVSTLDFDNNSLIDIKFPSDNMSIKKLYLNNNLFTEVPKGISQLKGLDSFYFADNNVVFIGDELNTLENLVILEMQDNKLSTLPYPTGRFEFINPNLVSINFTGNSELTELPFLYLNDSPFDATIYTDSNIPPEEVYKLGSNRTRYNRYRGNESVSGGGLSDGFEYMQNLSSTNNPAYEILSRMRNKKSTDQLDAFSVGNAVPELGEGVMSDAPLLIYGITLEGIQYFRMGVSTLDENGSMKVVGEYINYIPENTDNYKKVDSIKFITSKKGELVISIPLGYSVVGVYASGVDITDTLTYNADSDKYRFTIAQMQGPLEIDIKIIKKTPAPDVPKLPTQSQQDKAMQVFDIIQDELGEYDAGSIVNIISYWFKEHTRYGFDTQADTELSPYKSDIYDYTSKLLEYGNNNQDGKHMMICNQSAVLTKILLESQGIPCRIISGMASEGSTLSGIGHAWNEYRNTQKGEWVSIDNTPTQKPSKELAPEMYDIVADLGTISSSLEKKAHRELISSALRSGILDIKDSMYTNQDIYDIIAIISKIPSNTIHTVKVSSLNITELPGSLSKLHALKSIDISDSTIMLSKRLINSLLQIPKLENIYMRKAQKIQYNDFIPPSLDRKISIPIIVTPGE